MPLMYSVVELPAFVEALFHAAGSGTYAKVLTSAVINSLYLPNR